MGLNVHMSFCHILHLFIFVTNFGSRVDSHIIYHPFLYQILLHEFYLLLIPQLPNSDILATCDQHI
jgi:hypothetical protein